MERVQKNFKEINDFLKSIIFIDDITFLKLALAGGYSLSIVTASHYDSAELGTVEVALLKNGKLKSEDFIIHYMPYSLWLDFVGDIQQAQPDEYERIFKEYKAL